MDKIANTIETLFAQSAGGLPAKYFADVMDRLVWCLGDNGAAIVALQQRWLAGDDPEKVEVALALSEVEPFANEDEARTQLKRISERWPHLRSACEQYFSLRNPPDSGRQASDSRVGG